METYVSIRIAAARWKVFNNETKMLHSTWDNSRDALIAAKDMNRYLRQLKAQEKLATWYKSKIDKR